MAKNSFNFQAKLGLETKEFKKGARDAKGILNGLQSDFRSFAASLIAGLSIGSIFDKMKDSALRLSNAMNTLKNVSESNGSILDSYGENIDYVKGLADKYGQNILSLSENYAKFAAATRSSNMTMEDQQKVFTSLVKAAGYFHLSADQTNDMMNAVTQMMSKGKVASEELRRQLGNTLPGAFQMMADACGVSTAKLEDMMKKGEVLAADVLPKFAAVLNQATQGGNFDNLQASINKLENTWLEFVEKSGFKNFYKGLIDWSNKGLKVIANNASEMDNILFATFGTGLLSYIKNTGDRAIHEMGSTIKGMEDKLKFFEGHLKSLKKRTGTESISSIKTDGGLSYFTPIGKVTDREKQKIIDMNNLLLESEKLRRRVGNTPMLTKDEIKNIEKLNENLKKTVVDVNATTSAFKAMNVGMKALWTTIKGVGKSLIIFAIMEAALYGITKLYEAIKEKLTYASKEAERLNNITKSHNDNIQESITSTEEEIAKGKQFLKIITNQNVSLAGRKEALNRLADLTGNIKLKDLNIDNIKEGTKEYLKLVDAFDLWSEAIKKNALIHAYAQEVAKAKVEVDKLQVKLDELGEKGSPIYKTKVGAGGAYANKLYTVLDKDAMSERDKNIDETQSTINRHNEFMASANKLMENNIEEYSKLVEQYRNVGKGKGEGEEDVETDLQKVHEDFLKKERELKNQLKEGAIDQKKYNDEFDELLIDTWRKAAATGEINLADLVTKNSLTTLDKFYQRVAAGATIAMSDKSKDIIKQWEKELMDEIEKMGKEIDDYFKKEVAQQKIVFDIHAGNYDAKKDTRNSLLDYKKTMSDIYDENLNITEKYIDDLEDKYKELNEKLTNVGDYSDKLTIIKQLAKLQEQIKLAKKEAVGFEDLMNLSIIEEDIKELSKELAIGIWSSARNIVGGLDAITQAHENLKETLNDKDSTGWEKFIASFEMLGSVIDGVIGSFETFSELMKIATMLSGAEEAKSIALGKVKDKETASIIANTSAKGANLLTTTAAAGATAAEAGATTALALAKEKEAMATAIAAAAKMGYPALLGTIPSAAAVVKASLASLQAFAKGGIVGGNSTRGDRNIIRANTGEMILNKGQQGALWNMLNGKGGIGGNVQFKIKGADLIGVINNENSRRRG